MVLACMPEGAIGFSFLGATAFRPLRQTDAPVSQKSAISPPAASEQAEVLAGNSLWTSLPLQVQRMLLNPLTGPEKLEDLLVSTLVGSHLIYCLAEVRGIVRHHSENVEFEKSKAITAQFDNEEERVFQNRNLESPISFQDIIDFVAQNRQYLSIKREELVLDKIQPKDRLDRLLCILRVLQGELVFDPTESKPQEEVDKISEILTVLKLLNAKSDTIITEFDDKFSNEELVYGLTVNRTNKRITICFRGSCGGKDWATNLNYKYTSPDHLEEACGQINIHGGFASYLFDENRDGVSKYDGILQILKDTYREYPGYDFYVTGHSLGGALAVLLSMSLAATQEIPDMPLPIKTITYACPPVGDKSYAAAFEALEKEGKLRHIRVTNDGDVIPLTPFPIQPRYTQTGINLHFRDKNEEMEVTRDPDARNAFQQLKFPNLLSSVDAHGLKAFDENLFIKANKDQMNKGFEEFYVGVLNEEK